MNNNLPSLLSPLNLTLDDLLLDPNNPRFSELGEELNPVAEGRFADEKVQANTLEKMKDSLFDVAELRDTIKTIGFLPMDRIVVRKWKGQTSSGKPRYVVIEGNRRVTALKWLVNLHDIGKETFSDSQLKNFTQLECLLLNDELAPASASLILPGLRHVSGIKEWGAYQKAKAVHALRKSGMSSQEAAQSLGLSTKSANSAYRCFLALEQMKSDEEFGEYAEPRMYSYFEEVFKRPNVKNWLDWSDEKEQFCAPERVNEFYSWMVPQGDDKESKLPESKSVRALSQILSDENALNVLRLPEGTLSRALARFEVDHPEDWYPKVVSAISAIKSLTPDMLRELDQSTIKSLEELRQRIDQAFKDRESLLAVS
jgi:ParB/Sulfiredoxin domain